MAQHELTLNIAKHQYINQVPRNLPMCLIMSRLRGIFVIDVVRKVIGFSCAQQMMILTLIIDRV